MHRAIEKVDFSSWPFKLKVSNGDEIYAFSVIIATGATFRKLDVPGEQEYWGKGVVSCPKCDAPFTKGKEVLVVGGGDTAIEYALQLVPYAQKVTIALRSESGRASEHMHKKLDAYEQVSFLYNQTVSRIMGDGKQVTQVELIDTISKKKTDFKTDWVFLDNR